MKGSVLHLVFHSMYEIIHDADNELIHRSKILQRAIIR
jgi:hypothetical protein